MSEKSIAVNLIDKIPEDWLSDVTTSLQDAAGPNEMPNKETLAAFAELDGGGGIRFSGSTEQLFLNLTTD